MTFAKNFVDIDDYFVIEVISNNGLYIMKKAIEKKTGRFVFLFESRYDRKDDDESKYLQKIVLRHIDIYFYLHHPAILKVKKINIFNCFGLTLITKFLTNWNISTLTKEYLDTKGQNKDKMNPLIRSKIIFGVASAMNYLHQQHIINKNLTLENIFLDNNYEPKILIPTIYDFDKFLNTANDYFYFAPELLLGDSYSCSIDVYSFAFLVYKMFSKRLIFRSGIEYFNLSRFRFFDNVVNGVRPSKPDLMPDCYWDLVSACFSDDRPSFHQIVETLKDDKFAIQEFGMKTDIQQLHEYQKRISE